MLQAGYRSRSSYTNVWQQTAEQWQKVTSGSFNNYPIAPCFWPTYVRDNARHEYQVYKAYADHYMQFNVNLHGGEGYGNWKYYRVGDPSSIGELMTKTKYKIYYLKPVY